MESHFVLAIANDTTDKVYIYDSSGRVTLHSHAHQLLDVYFPRGRYEVDFLKPHETFRQDSEDDTNCGVYVLMMAWYMCAFSLSSCDSQSFVSRFGNITLDKPVEVGSNTPSFCSHSQ
jgi:hypothetical protein